METEKIKNYTAALNYFDAVCRKEKIWYSLANDTLLSAINNSNLFLRKQYLEVFISKDTFIQLRTKYSNNVIDSSQNSKIFYLFSIFKIEKNPIVIKMILVVETTQKKLYKLNKFSYRLKNHYSDFLMDKKGINLKKSLIYFFNFKLGFFIKRTPLYFLSLYEQLFDSKHRGFYLINDLNQSFSKNWIANISFKTLDFNFINTRVCVLKEYKLFLLNRYGQNYSKTPLIIKEKEVLNI